jgi:hypothetical protein
MKGACGLLYCHLWPVWLYDIFPHFLSNFAIFGKKLFGIKCVFRFSLQLLCEIFIIIKEIQRDIIINVLMSSCKVRVIRVGFSLNSNLLDRFSKNTEIQHFWNIRSVGTEFPADGRTDMTKLMIAFRSSVNAPQINKTPVFPFFVILFITLLPVDGTVKYNGPVVQFPLNRAFQIIQCGTLH